MARYSRPRDIARRPRSFCGSILGQRQLEERMQLDRRAAPLRIGGDLAPTRALPLLLRNYLTTGGVPQERGLRRRDLLLNFY